MEFKSPVAHILQDSGPGYVAFELNTLTLEGEEFKQKYPKCVSAGSKG